MNVREYMLFDLERTTDIEKNIILSLGDDIHNRIVLQQFDRKYKHLEKTLNILDRKFNYNSDALYIGLSLLCLKNIIGLRNNINNELENLAVGQSNTTRYNKDKYIHFIYLIHETLVKNKDLLSKKIH